VSYTFTTGEYGTYNITESDTGEGGPLSYDNETAESFMKLNGLSRDGFDNLYADGTLAPGHKYGSDWNVYSTDPKKDNRPIGGAVHLGGKKYVFFGKQQIDMYLYRGAFINPEMLYLTIGHELIHVGLYNQGISSNEALFHNHEATAYSWSIAQAALWGLSTKTYIDNMKYHIGKGGVPYPYNTMVPMRPARPVRP
jgi:hypothetical protein